MKIPIPQITTEQIDIFSFGFNTTLNRSLNSVSTPSVYNLIEQAVSPAQVYSGTPISISSISTGSKGALEMISSNKRFFYQNITKPGLVDGVGNDIFRVEMDTKSGTSNDTSGGTIEWTLLAKDVAQLQSRTGITTWAATNHAGTIKVVINEIGGSVSLSSGSLTGSWSSANGTDLFNLIFTPDSNLTPTDLVLYAKVNSLNFRNITLL